MYDFTGSEEVVCTTEMSNLTKGFAAFFFYWGFIPGCGKLKTPSWHCGTRFLFCKGTHGSGSWGYHHHLYIYRRRNHFGWLEFDE